MSQAGSIPGDESIGGRRRLLLRWLVVVAAALASGLITWMLPNAITLSGIEIGDIGPPLVGLDKALQGQPPYGVRLVMGVLAQYPFTTMIMLAPFLLVPVPWIAPLFSTLSGGVLAWALTSGSQWWRLMMLVSVPYIMALYSVQWSPLFTAALVVPALLFVAVAKPQLGVVLLVSGRWRIPAVVVAAVIVVLSFVVRPTWVGEWMSVGILEDYEGRIPLLIAPGFLLAASLAFVKSRRGRVLAAMAVIPQRYWYDQLLLFMVPATWRQMLALVVSSWLGLWWALSRGWDPSTGDQDLWVWRIVVVSLYLPALVISGLQWFNERSRSQLPAGSCGGAAGSSPGDQPGPGQE